jgi:hypothetical protein
VARNGWALGVALALAAAAGLGAGWLIWAQDPAPAADPVGRSAPAPPTQPSLATSTGARTSHRATARADVEEEAESVAVERTGAADAPFPTLLVHVLDEDGSPMHSTHVYALPAGASGTDEWEEISTASLQEGGVASLRVPVAGLYDVGVLTFHIGGPSALATDVAIPGELTLRVPPCDDVTVVLSDELRSMLRPTVPGTEGKPDQVDGVSLSLAATDPPRMVAYPGRDELPSSGSTVGLSRDVPRQSLRLARGRRYRVTQADARFPVAADPMEVTPPATVTLSPRGARVMASLRFTPADRTFDRDVQLSVLVRAGEQDVFFHSVRLPAGVSVGALVGLAPFHVSAREGTLSWSGDGIRAGSAPYRAGHDGDATLGLTFHVESAPAPSPPGEGASTRRRRVTIVAEGPAFPESVDLALGDFPGEWPGVEWDAALGRGSASLPDGWTWLAAHGPGTWVSEVVASSPRGGDVALRLRRGGCLVLVPDGVVPDGMTLRVSRADGLPFFLNDELRDEPVPVEAGLVLGPLEPGRVRLSVRLAASPPWEVGATVRADAYAPVVVPTRPPR